MGSKRKAKMSLSKVPLFPPKSATIKMRYVEDIAIDAGAGAYTVHRFRANSIADPNHTGTGHQPLYHDILELMYNHYTVVKSRIRVRFINEDTTNHLYAGIYLNDDTVSPSNATEYMEQQNNKYIIVQPQGAGSVKTVKHAYSAWQTYRMSPQSSQLKAVIGSTPSEQTYYELWTRSVNSNDPTPLVCNVMIEYMVLWSELRTQAQS